MKIQTSGAECAAGEGEQLVPPVGRRRKRALLGSWQAALQAVTIFISIISLTLSCIVFMVLLYTPVSNSPLGQARDLDDLRQVVDLQRQMISRLQREDNYQDARQKALQSALAASGLLTDDVRARLEGIERALMAKEQVDVPRDIAELVELGSKNDDSSLIGSSEENDEHGDTLIGRPDGHDMWRDSMIGRPDGHERLSSEMRANTESEEESYEDIIG